MAADLQTRLTYLGHVLRNTTACIEGCLREIEARLKEAIEAVEAFESERTREVENGKDDNQVSECCSGRSDEGSDSASSEEAE